MRIHVSNISFFLIVTILSMAGAGSCRRDNTYLGPTGWEAVGEPFDSLTRALEIGMAFDMPDDSIVILSKEFARRAFKDGTSAKIRNRAHYWLARAARRTGDERTATLEFNKATEGRPTSETEYIERRIVWHNEDPDSKSRNERYQFLRGETDYYENRKDAVMLYGLYMDLFRLMRDIGYTSRQLEYLNSADSCISVISHWRRIVGPRFNTACTLIDCGDTAAAREICIELAEDPKVLADADLNPLAQYNLYVVEKDTAALNKAYLAMERSGSDPFSLFPIVCAHKAEEALKEGSVDIADSLIAEMESRLGSLGQSENLLVALRVKAKVKERSGSPREAETALREYAEAADSLQAQQTRAAVIDAETLAEVKKYERRLNQAEKSHKIMLWGGLTLLLSIVAAVAFFIRRLVSKYRNRQKVAEISKGEAERRELAIRIQAEKKGQSVEELETFQNLFSRIRPEFIDQLRERCPGLGNSSIRVACYIVMGLDTKEIADALNVRPESVKQARWRLRKALDIPKNMNLQTFLVSMNSGKVL